MNCIKNIRARMGVLSLVILIDHDREENLRIAHPLLTKRAWWAYRYRAMPVRVMLLLGGAVEGPSFVTGWVEWPGNKKRLTFAGDPNNALHLSSGR